MSSKTGMNLITAYPQRLRQQNVVVPITNASLKRIQFGDIPNLRDRLIMSVAVRTSTEILFTPNGETLEDPRGCFMTLIENNTDEVFSQIPLAEAMPQLNNGNMLEFNGLFVNFPKSYIEFSQAFTPTVGRAIFLVFYFAPISFKEWEANQKLAFPNKISC